MVNVKDVAGNQSMVVSTFTTVTQPPPPEDCDALRARILVLEAENAALRAKIAAAIQVLN